MTQIHYDAEKCVITNSHKEGEDYDLPSCFRRAEIREIPFERGDLQVFSGGTPCFTKGVSVLTKDGYKPIEDIKVGEEVLTHLGRFRKVLRVGSKKSNELVEVKIVGREKIVCTAEHPFPLLASHHRKSGELYFDDPVVTHIKDGQGMYAMVVNSNLDSFGVDIPKLPKVYNATAKEIYELCGWYVGDGYIRGWKGKAKKAIMLCLNHENIAIFNNRFGGKINYTICKAAGIFKIQICCTEFARFLHKHFGELAHGKKIPMWAYNKEVREEFIKGYWQTDGCSLRDGHAIQWSTVSQALAYGIADMIGQTCVSRAVMPKTTVIEGRTVNQRDFFTVRHNDAANHFHARGMFDCVKVREVNRLSGRAETVYNLEVEEDHTYIVNGIVTHNCQDISVAGKRRGMAEDSGSRSSLAFHYQRIIDEARPAFTLWENVVGAFSSNGGKDFIWFVNKCAESGYSMAWRVLDAQYTTTEEFPRAVPQRRRRIWLVGYRENDWRVPARVVFEYRKYLTEEPPVRIPGKGFTEINKDFDGSDVDVVQTSRKKAKKDSGQDLFSFDFEESCDDDIKVSRQIELSDMPCEADFSRVSKAEIYRFAKMVVEPCYIGHVFRADKKKGKAKSNIVADLFSSPSEEAVNEVEVEASEYEGADKISPEILANIGNAGILANGVIATINCHEWTSGIQLSPKKHRLYMELAENHDLLNANLLLPNAYDGTVCGLSDVLEDNPSPKYNLSWRACFGILKRAAGRGKELPKALEAALVTNIRENAGIVKWSALNGKATKKKETDLSERETAMLCFNEYIASVARFEDVVPVEPVKHSSESDESDGDDVDEAGDSCEEDGLPDEGNHDGRESGNEIEPDVDDASKVAKASRTVKSIDTKLDASRMEDGVSPTLLASSYKEPPAIVK